MQKATNHISFSDPGSGRKVESFEGLGGIMMTCPICKSNSMTYDESFYSDRGHEHIFTCKRGAHKIYPKYWKHNPDTGKRELFKDKSNGRYIQPCKGRTTI